MVTTDLKRLQVRRLIGQATEVGCHITNYSIWIRLLPSKACKMKIIICYCLDLLCGPTTQDGRFYNTGLKHCEFSTTYTSMHLSNSRYKETTSTSPTLAASKQLQPTSCPR